MLDTGTSHHSVSGIPRHHRQAKGDGDGGCGAGKEPWL